MGWIGLQVFFVISGLVMANSARTATPWDFAIGRILPSLCGGLVRRGNQYHLGSLIVIRDADDVILAEIAAGLNLDQLQHNLSGVLQPVDAADRDIDRFILVHDLHGSMTMTQAAPRSRPNWVRSVKNLPWRRTLPISFAS
jgi:hypothetical protein